MRWIVVLAACHAPLPPPVAPFIHGKVRGDGWAVSPSVARGVDGVDGLDLIDPAAPDTVVRVIRAPAETKDLGRGYHEHVASRGVEVRVVRNGHETLLAPASCTRLDAIMRATGGLAFGSVRFDCDGMHGDLELEAGGYAGATTATGFVEASDATLARTRFEPDQAEVDPRGVLFWDHRYPRVVFELDGDTLHVTSTAASVGSFELESASCRVLKMSREEAGFVRVGTNQHTLYDGTIELDCTTPRGGRITGKLEVNG